MQQKTIWRTFLLIGILTFSTLLSMTSCKKEVEKLKTVDYIYKNTSGKDLELFVFNSSKIQIKSYKILNGEQITSNTSVDEAFEAFHYENDINMIGDSVSIRFFDNRCIGYSKSVPDRIFDIRKYDNYGAELIARDQFSLIYSITVEEYNSSVTCGE